MKGVKIDSTKIYNIKETICETIIENLSVFMCKDDHMLLEMIRHPHDCFLQWCRMIWG